MKKITLITLFFITLSSFAQHTAYINGELLDLEDNKVHLVYAKVLIKETGAEVLSNEKGLFRFENLKDGNYTLISSFIGYETKETKIKVLSNKASKAKIFLEASSISLDELVLTFATANNK